VKAKFNTARFLRARLTAIRVMVRSVHLMKSRLALELSVDGSDARRKNEN